MKSYLQIVCSIILVSVFLFGCSMNVPSGSKAIPNIDPYNSTNWSVEWSDEFTSPVCDYTVWSNEVFPAGTVNNEWENYTASLNNSYITNIANVGMLVIKAIQTDAVIAEGHYTSARLITLDHKSFQYGKVAASIKLPYGQGTWPAFWMLGTNINSIGWPDCGEIDIMEMIGGGLGKDNKVYGTIHGPGGFSVGGNVSLSSGNFCDDFHEFGILWSNNTISWYLDGTKYFQADGYAVFNHPFFIILNLAIGGDWPGSPNISTQFPQYMYVDWVRVYTN